MNSLAYNPGGGQHRTLPSSDRQAAHCIAKYSTLFVKKRDFMQKECSSFVGYWRALDSGKLFYFPLRFATMVPIEYEGYIAYPFVMLASFCYSKSDALRDLLDL